MSWEDQNPEKKSPRSCEKEARTLGIKGPRGGRHKVKPETEKVRLLECGLELFNKITEVPGRFRTLFLFVELLEDYLQWIGKKKCSEIQISFLFFIQIKKPTFSSYVSCQFLPEEDSSLSNLLISQSRLLENWAQLFLFPRMRAAANKDMFDHIG